jgi:hypothetical protein
MPVSAGGFTGSGGFGGAGLMTMPIFSRNLDSQLIESAFLYIRLRTSARNRSFSAINWARVRQFSFTPTVPATCEWNRSQDAKNSSLGGIGTSPLVMDLISS